MATKAIPPAPQVDGDSLVFLRVAVGLLVAASGLRFWAKGWVETLLLAPAHHFPYPGFEWVPVPGPALTYALFAIIVASGLVLASGKATRTSAALAFLSFSWVELIDLSYYLNHYYFLSCLLLTLALVPPLPDATGQVPRSHLWLIRAQIGLVYVFAGVAKLDADWLVHAQPLTIWFARHADLSGPFGLPLGALLAHPAVAHAASWAGALFDLAVVPALCWRPTRAPAYLALVVFHVATGLLFPIGLFPAVMIACATIFFEPDWPKAAVRGWSTLSRARAPSPPSASGRARALRARAPRAAFGVAAALLCVQLLLPWRHWLYPGPVSWTEQGGRFAYRVMLVEKGGAVDFRVLDRRSGARWRVDPSDELSPLQVKMMSTQPDMIASYARHLAARLERERPGAELAVYADAFVALNGRHRARLIDPEVDLGQAPPDSTWILPAPKGPP